MLSCAGANIDDMIGGVHRILVMLHNNERIAEVTQMPKGREQAVVVALMQPDARLIKDVEHPHQPRADLRREADALCLSARQRRCRTRERQIVESHIEEKMEACMNFLQNLSGYFCLTRRKILLCLR